MAPLSLSLSLLALLATAEAFTPTLKFNLTFPDQNGWMVWKPGPDGAKSINNDVLGWNVSYSGTPWSEWRTGMVGEGASSHTTSSAASTVGVVSVFTDMYVHGTYEATSTSHLQFAVDGSVINDTESGVGGDTVAAAAGLEWGLHNATFNMRETGDAARLSVTAITLTSGLQTTATSLEEVKSVVQAFVLDGAANPFYETKGLWNVSLQAASIGQEDLSSLQGSNGAEVIVTVPPKTTFMILNGTMSPWFRAYYIKVDPPLPFREAAREIIYSTNLWTVPNTITYAAPLDPAVNYTVSLKSQSRWDKPMSLHAMTFYSAGDDFVAPPPSASDSPAAPTESATESPSASGSSGKKGLSAGAIGGMVVGVVLGIAILALLAFCLYRRHRKSPVTPVADDDKFEIDTNAQHTPTPYAYTYSGYTKAQLESPHLPDDQPHTPFSPESETAVDSSTTDAAPVSFLAVPGKIQTQPPGDTPRDRSPSTPDYALSPLLPERHHPFATPPRPTPVSPEVSVPDTPIRHEKDMGPLGEIVLPPMYDEAWSRRASEVVAGDAERGRGAVPTQPLDGPQLGGKLGGKL